MNKIFDLHNDYLTSIKTSVKQYKYLINKKTMVDDLISAIWTTEMNNEQVIKCIEKTLNLMRNNEKNKILKQNLRFSIEDLHFLTKKSLYQIINYKPTYCGLTWNYDNLLAGGALEGGDMSLLGIEVVKELEKNNIIVDTAHLSEKSFMTFSNITEKPILCSHTAVNSLTTNNRNLKDYQIKMIKESGGLIGIALVGKFLTNEKKATVSDIARHIDYIVSRYGEEYVALGTDFYGTKDLPKGIKNYNNLILLEERLKILGYSTETISNIFYNNAKKFFNNSTII